MTRKQTVGENLLYVMVWAAIILVPVLNSQMMSELHISFENVLIAWRQIAPYFIIFIIHNSVLAPRLMLRRKYKTYLLCDLALIIAVFWLVNIYEEHLTDRFLPHGDPEAFDAYRKASFSNLEMYWNVVLGFFMTGANTGIKLIYQSMRDEQQMEELKRQNLEAEMDYLKYQINPHFFMNTLNNIHSLIDIDAAEAPIMDGSAREYAEKIVATGLVEQDADRKYYQVTEKMVYTIPEKGVAIILYPDDEFSVSVHVDYNSKAVSYTHLTLPTIA